MRSIYSIKGTIEQLHFIITKTIKNFSEQYDCAINNTRKIPYFLACQKICRTCINKLKRKNTQSGKIIHHEVYCFFLNRERIASILQKYALSKFLSVKKDVNLSTRKSVGRAFLTFGTRYDEFGRKKEINY